MRSMLFFLAVISVCWARRKLSERPSDDEVSDSGSGSNLRPRAASFPDYFRVEVEIVNMQNNASIRSDGKKCDFNSKCDPVVSAFIDIDKPSSPFPGAAPALSSWPVIFSVTDNESPVIGKSVNRDICGGALDKIAARVNVLDSDPAGMSDLISQFDCLFQVRPREIAVDAASAQWDAPTECKGYFQSGKIRLFARKRAYQITSSNCGVSGLGASQQNTETTLSVLPHGHIPGQHDNIRLDVELVQLLNPQGITFKKVACDSTSKCDPEINVHLDTDKPLADFPGSKTLPEFQTIFKATDVDSPVVNKNISKDICGGALSNVNLRAQVLDRDTLSSADEIESFNCLFKVDYKIIASDVSSADWTPTQDCAALHPGNDIRLQYRYRMYDISSSVCGLKA